jgi:hypothetical protein
MKNYISEKSLSNKLGRDSSKNKIQRQWVSRMNTSTHVIRSMIMEAHECDRHVIKRDTISMTWRLKAEIQEYFLWIK